MNINPVEAVWLGVGLIAAVVTLLNLIDAEQARRAVFGTSRAWRIQAAANVRREVVSLVMAIGTVLIVVPSLGRPGDVEMTALILVFMSIPFGLAVNSIFDARTRRTLARMVAAEMAAERRKKPR